MKMRIINIFCIACLAICTVGFTYADEGGLPDCFSAYMQVVEDIEAEYDMDIKVPESAIKEILMMPIDSFRIDLRENCEYIKKLESGDIKTYLVEDGAVISPKNTLSADLYNITQKYNITESNGTIIGKLFLESQVYGEKGNDRTFRYVNIYQAGSYAISGKKHFQCETSTWKPTDKSNVAEKVHYQGYMNTGTGVLLPVHTSYDVVYYSWQF